MTGDYTLYALPHSLYSGRARSYLIKRGITFRELSTGHESFKNEVLPKAQLPTIPTLVTPHGEVIRDGAAIIAHFEEPRGWPSLPTTPRQRTVSLLFDVIGTDGLLRPAMHYRWNFPDDNLAFVRRHFLHAQRDTPEREAKTDHMMDRMRHAARIFGVTEASQSVVEALYLDVLTALNDHFAQFPYLFGDRPSLGDFGLLGPLYAHLGRDPYPLGLMQREAPSLYRWVERMNRADRDAPEFFGAGEDFLPGDAIPPTLVRVLQVLAEDFVPETAAAAATLKLWLAAEAPAAGEPAVGRLATSPGTAQFDLRGVPVEAIAQPHRFYLLQRVQSCYDALAPDARQAVFACLVEVGMEKVLALRLPREICRNKNLEVWGELT